MPRGKCAVHAPRAALWPISPMRPAKFTAPLLALFCQETHHQAAQRSFGWFPPDGAATTGQAYSLVQESRRALDFAWHRGA